MIQIQMILYVDTKKRVIKTYWKEKKGVWEKKIKSIDRLTIGHFSLKHGKRVFCKIFKRNKFDLSICLVY